MEDTSPSKPKPGEFYLHPHYRVQRPVEATMLKVRAGLDDYPSEAYAFEIESRLARWSDSLRKAASDVSEIAKTLADDFSGVPIRPTASRKLRGGIVDAYQEEFGGAVANKNDFVRELRSTLSVFSQILTAEFQVTGIELGSAGTLASTELDTQKVLKPGNLRSRIRYEIVGSGTGFHREQRVGEWDVEWKVNQEGAFFVRQWRPVTGTRSRAMSPIFADAAQSALGACPSFGAQLLHGSDYWRTVLDGACGIDVYGHNGISVADIDGDGWDDLYVCQPGGLPNRLYRNRRDGTFEDITEASGLGILDNTACAVFADFQNRGRQDVIVVRTDGPQLFVNDGTGKFDPKPDAFQFVTPPQGTFTGASAADYDRDGWLDIYFCLYIYYQGTDQYRYPLPYYDAENGPPNFLMHNNRDGTFRDVTHESGLTQNNTRYSFCAEWNDFNNDGWPDLYVVNDFGRKNLYRNHGDGSFTDVAAQAGVEDVGAGMGVCWLDHDNRGAEDLYVADMWTAAGTRISGQPEFQKSVPDEVRSFYRKHAMGNSFFRNTGDGSFRDITASAQVGMGRWSWACGAWDFDHDGLADLYVTDGMVSGTTQPRVDLNSFFWRQVVANSPVDAKPARSYEEGWNAINELIRSDGTWSGFERNVFYANNGDGSFSDVSGVVELDFLEDGRSFALADFDRDGRVEVFLKNRNAPQLRLLKNVTANLPASICFRLRGTKSNRDAIGAVVTIVGAGAGRNQTRSVQAGSGFLCQHSKEIFFGLGNSEGPIRASIRWPSGTLQELKDLPPDHCIWVEEGSASFRAEPFSRRKPLVPVTEKRGEQEFLPWTTETWLLAPVLAPDFSLVDINGQQRGVAQLRGAPLLLLFWTMQSHTCEQTLTSLAAVHRNWEQQGLSLVAVNVEQSSDDKALREWMRRRNLSVPILQGTEEVAAVYNILYRYVFDRHRDLPLPTGFLVNEAGEIVKIYQGRVDPGQVERDVHQIPKSQIRRLEKALPFPGLTSATEFGRNYLALGSVYFQREYYDHAETWFRQASQNDPASAEALYGLGSVYLHDGKLTEARSSFESALKGRATYPDTIPDAWNNLGVLAMREGRAAESIGFFHRSLELNPNHLLALDNLGNVFRQQKRWDEARKFLERALEVSPQDAEANYSMGMISAQTGSTERALEYLQRALKVRPAYPEALNNLGILYLVTKRRDDAVTSFEQCIRVAPEFDPAFINLAKVYAQEGANEKARALLQEVLKRHPENAEAQQILAELAR